MGVETPTLVDLILAGDQDALAGYYDGRAPSVYAYCAEVCPSEQVEGAVLASFTDFLGRVRGAGTGADLDDLLRKSTRTAASSRMQVGKRLDAACRSIPELIAARANDELQHDEDPIKSHLEHCRSCRRAAQRLVEAEDALVGPASRQPPDEIRTTWLLMASKGAEETKPAPAGAVAEPLAPEPEPPSPAPAPPAPAPESPAPAPEPPTPAPEPPGPDPDPPAPAPEPPPAPDPEPPAQPAAVAPPPEPPAPQPMRARRRSGGLIGAARRVARGR